MNINRIIGKFFSGRSGDEELEALEVWKKEAQENMKALEEMKKIAELSNGLQGYEDFHTENAWENFERKNVLQKNEAIESKETTESTKSEAKEFPLNKWIKIAAVFVVLFGCIHLVTNGVQIGPDVDEPLKYAAKTEVKEIELKDGSGIVLDKSAVLTEVENRKTTLKGRAFFDVRKSTDTQFEISLPLGNVTVLGTKFTITAQDNYTEIYVEEGSVRFDLEGAKSQVLVVGDLLRVAGKEMVLVKNSDDNYSSWRLKRLVFADNSIQEVVSALNRHFKKEIILDNPAQFEKCSFTTKLEENQSLEDILNEFGISHSLKYKIIDNTYHVTSCKC